MNHLPDRMGALRDTLLEKISVYGQQAGVLGQRARQLVFGFHRRSTIPIDRWSFSVKTLHDHKLVQRQRTFQQGGGESSGLARHAMDKARHQKQL